MPTLDPVRHFFNCSCHTEGLIFEYDAEYKEANVALWHYGNYTEKLGWRERIRWCWSIIRKGLPWTDAVSMSPSEARRFAETILANVKDQE